MAGDSNTEQRPITDLLPDFNTYTEKEYKTQVAIHPTRRLILEGSFSDDVTFGCRWTTIQSKDDTILGYHVVLKCEVVRESFPSFTMKPALEPQAEFIYSQAYNKFYIQPSAVSPSSSSGHGNNKLKG